MKSFHLFILEIYIFYIHIKESSSITQIMYIIW